jgi:hypothetical protein
VRVPGTPPPPPEEVTAPEDVVVKIRPKSTNTKYQIRKQSQKTQKRKKKKTNEKTQRESGDFYLITFLEKELFTRKQSETI